MQLAYNNLQISYGVILKTSLLTKHMQSGIKHSILLSVFKSGQLQSAKAGGIDV